MLVAPISSSSIVVGKRCVGGAISSLQSLVLIALGGFVHVPYRPGIILGLMAVVFVTSFTMTAFGLVLAACCEDNPDLVMPLSQMLLLPLMFLSGSLYPLGRGVPHWLQIAAALHPVTYAVTSAQHRVPLPPENGRHGTLLRRPDLEWMASAGVARCRRRRCDRGAGAFCCLPLVFADGIAPSAASPAALRLSSSARRDRRHLVVGELDCCGRNIGLDVLGQPNRGSEGSKPIWKTTPSTTWCPLTPWREATAPIARLRSASWIGAQGRKASDSCSQRSTIDSDERSWAL